jgi:hypothetical protein
MSDPIPESTLAQILEIKSQLLAMRTMMIALAKRGAIDPQKFADILDAEAARIHEELLLLAEDSDPALATRLDIRQWPPRNLPDLPDAV